MSLKVGIVGLPNVGKSTLFNALLKKRVALSANYPFATVEPNVGVVAVPDARLEKLAEVVARSTSEESPSTSLRVKEPTSEVRKPPIVPAVVEFVDIAGLVAGAHKGEGLGNKFLAHIREVDAIVHVVRDFGDVGVVRAGSVDPESDKEVVETELQLADLEVAQKLLDGAEKDKSLIDKDIITTTLGSMVVKLGAGRLASEVDVPERLESWKKSLPLLTLKPVLYVRNVDKEHLEGVGMIPPSRWKDTGNEIAINAKLEEELADFSEEEKVEYLKSVGVNETGLEKLIEAAYELLGLISFLTAGVKEVRAWTLPAGTPAFRASSTIHSDFEKHFIKADVVSFEDFVEFGGWKRAREKGKVRSEGKDYVVRDGDVVEFKIGS